MARLDRAGEGKAVQTGGHPGPTFTPRAAQAVSPPGDELAFVARPRAGSVQAEVLYQHGVPRRTPTYNVQAALIQETAYQSVLRSTRQQYHQRLAQVLAEGRFFPGPGGDPA